jgi:hypothetical protein
MENSPQAVTLECPANFYSDVIEGAGSSHIRCAKCPDGKISVKGSFAPSDCYVLCEEGLMNNPANMDECLPCSENSQYNPELKTCMCDPGFYGTGGGLDACKPCPDGSYCPGGRAVEVCDAAERQYSAPGSTGCKTCPPDAVSSEGKTCSCLRQGKNFNAETNLCE